MASDDSEPDAPARERLLAVAARRLKLGTSPYWVMTGFLFLSGVVGFLASVGLLHAGLDTMAVRYPLAVAAGYAAFLGLLWLWLRNQRGEGGGETADLANLAYAADVLTPDSRQSSGTSSAGVPNDLGLGSLTSGGDSDGCGWVVVAVLVTVAVAAVLLAAVWAIVMAPTLLAELLVDGLVVGSLPKRRTHHWTRTALQRTGWAALGLMAVLGLVGAGLEAVVPGAHTMGQAMGFGGAK